MAIDSLDRKILEIIQRDNRIPSALIADQVGLSPSAVQRRIKKLRRDGVIVADVSIVSPDAVGRKLTAIVDIEIARDRPLQKALDEFREMMVGSPEVIGCYHVTGEQDFIVVVLARDMKDYEEISRKLFVDNPNVCRYTSSLTISIVKCSTAVPVEEDQ